MFGSKLLGALISAFISIVPVNYDWDIWQFPQTRQVTVRYSTKIDVFDLGYGESVDLATISSGLEAQYQNAKRDYLVSFTHQVNCSQSCFYNMSNVNGYTLDDNNFVVYTQQKFYLTSSELYQKVSNFTQNGFVTESATFQSETSVHTIQLQIPRIDNAMFTINVNFPAVTNGLILDDIANHTLNSSSYLLRLTLNNMTNNRNIPSDIMQQYQTYIDNGDYSTAYTYITNYIDDQTTIENTKTNNVVNNYETKDTTLNQKVTEENNITLQFENQFTNTTPQLTTSHNSDGLLPSSGFVSSAQWVTARFNDFIRGTNSQYNAFGSLVITSLFIGFVMAVIGRIFK